MKKLTAIFLAVMLLISFSGCLQTTTHTSAPPSLSVSPSEQPISSSASVSQNKSCNCEELEFQIDDYNHPDLPDNIDDFLIGGIAPDTFERSVSGFRFLVLATFEEIQDETTEKFVLRFKVDKVYYGDVAGEDLTVVSYRFRFPTKMTSDVPRSNVTRFPPFSSYQTILCPYEEGRQYLLFLVIGEDGCAVIPISIIVPADDLKHSRLGGSWLKDTTRDFDVENCKNVDELAQYVIDRKGLNKT